MICKESYGLTATGNIFSNSLVEKLNESFKQFDFLRKIKEMNISIMLIKPVE